MSNLTIYSMNTTSIKKVKIGKKRRALLSAAALIIVPVSTVYADEGNKTEWGIGLAAQIKEHPYIDFDRDTQLLPYLFIENSWIKLNGPNLDFKIGTLNDFSFAVRSKFSFGDGYESSDSSVFNGMEDRDSSIWVGPSVNWESPFADISIEVLGDAMGNSKGQQASLELSKGFSLSPRIRIEPSLGATWFSDKYVDYYYGVNQAEATAIRAEYEGDSTMVINAGLRMTYNFDENQLVMFRAEMQSFSNEIKDSPLVDESTVSSFTFGYLYRF